jgi:crotonobetaine/carnitine-CoA ligase
VLAQSAFAETIAEAVRQSGVTPKVVSLDGGWGEALDYEASAATLPGVAVDPMDPALILYTSGSTDRPKGVVHSQLCAPEEASRVVDAWSIRPDDVLFSHMPMYHVSGLYCVLLPGMIRGATVAAGCSFSATRWTADLRSTRATVVPIVAAQVRMIMANSSIEPDRDRENCVRLTPCGMALPQDVESAFDKRFGTGPLYAISGSTEGIGLTYIEPAFGEHRWPSLGRPAADREIAIFDDEGKPLPFGAEGEICIRGERGAALMLEYWNKPEATAVAMAGGWYHTSDVGRMDADGYVYFVDRKKDIIKRAGDNVSASEVERVLCQFPGVYDAAVVGKPDPIRDWAIVAFIEQGDGESVDAEALIAHCQQNLARYKVPEEVRIIPELPRTSTGKLEKKALRDLLSS